MTVQYDVVLVANSGWYLYHYQADLVRKLCEKGASVAVMGPQDRYLDALPVDHFYIPLQRSSTNPFKELRTIFSLVRQLQRIKPKIVLNFTPKVNIYSTLAARLNGIDVVNNVSGMGIAAQKKGWLALLMHWLYRYTQPYARYILFQNDQDREQFISLGYVKPENAMRIPGSGVDINVFKPQKMLRRPTSVLTFGFFGRLFEEKGILDFLGAAHRLLDEGLSVEFVVVGAIDQEHEASEVLQEALQAQRPGIEIVGHLDDVIEVMRRCDCVVVPSRYREGLPRTLLEAGALGIPVIASDIPPCKEVVRDGETGLLFRAGDIHELADRMKVLTELSESQRAGMGKAARLRVCQHFSRDQVDQAYEQLIGNICGGRTPETP